MAERPKEVAGLELARSCVDHVGSYATLLRMLSVDDEAGPFHGQLGVMSA